MTKKEEWTFFYSKLEDYWKKTKTSSVPYDHEIYDWCEIQRNDPKLAKYKKDMLESIGFVWETELHPIHEKHIARMYSGFKKKGKINIGKDGEMSNFIRLWVYQKEKGVLPKNLQHAFSIRSMELSA